MFVMPGNHSALITLNRASHSHNVIRTCLFLLLRSSKRMQNRWGLLKRIKLSFAMSNTCCSYFFLSVFSTGTHLKCTHTKFMFISTESYILVLRQFFPFCFFKVKCLQIIETNASFCLLKVGQWAQAHPEEDLLLLHILEIVSCLWEGF